MLKLPSNLPRFLWSYFLKIYNTPFIPISFCTTFWMRFHLLYCFVIQLLSRQNVWIFFSSHSAHTVLDILPHGIFGTDFTDLRACSGLRMSFTAFILSAASHCSLRLSAVLPLWPPLRGSGCCPQLPPELLSFGPWLESPHCAPPMSHLRFPFPFSCLIVFTMRTSGTLTSSPHHSSSFAQLSSYQE